MESTGKGDANDAQVQAEDGDVSYEEAVERSEAEAKEQAKEQARAEAQAAVDAAQAKIDKLNEHLEGAKQGLADAQAKMEGV